MNLFRCNIIIFSRCDFEIIIRWNRIYILIQLFNTRFVFFSTILYATSLFCILPPFERRFFRAISPLQLLVRVGYMRRVFSPRYPRLIHILHGKFITETVRWSGMDGILAGTFSHQRFDNYVINNVSVSY